MKIALLCRNAALYSHERINSSPGLEGIEKATNVPVAEMIIEFIEKHAKAGKTRTRGKG